jgi:hypothetical protein
MRPGIQRVSHLVSLLHITTTVSGLFCQRDFHPLERQLALLHQIRTNASRNPIEGLGKLPRMPVPARGCAAPTSEGSLSGPHLNSAVKLDSFDPPSCHWVHPLCGFLSGFIDLPAHPQFVKQYDQFPSHRNVNRVAAPAEKRARNWHGTTIVQQKSAGKDVETELAWLKRKKTHGEEQKSRRKKQT